MISNNDPHGLLSKPLPSVPLSTYEENLPYNDVNIQGSPPNSRRISPDIITSWTRLLADSPNGTTFVPASADKGLTVTTSGSSNSNFHSLLPTNIDNGSSNVSASEESINKIHGLLIHGWTIPVARNPIKLRFSVANIFNLFISEVILFTFSCIAKQDTSGFYTDIAEYVDLNPSISMFGLVNNNIGNNFIVHNDSLEQATVSYTVYYE